jgi:hypothetical protein
VIEEIVNDAVDSALDSEDIEEEVDKVLTAIAGETATYPASRSSQEGKGEATRSRCTGCRGGLC